MKRTILIAITAMLIATPVNAASLPRPSDCKFPLKIGKKVTLNWPWCGCGTSLKVFGEVKRELLRAAEWGRKYPRVNKRSAQPGDVVGRSSHVAYIQSGSYPHFTLYDPNSGGGRARIRESDLSEFRWVVRPKGLYAQN